MMRSSIVAALVLSPLMVHAQANSSAQLQSSVTQPKGLMLSAAAAPTKSGVRVSTGVVAPKLIKTVSITEDGSRIGQLIPGSREVVVAMIVDEAGKPTALKIVKSLGDTMDKNVLAAVSDYRFVPGTVSGQPTEFPVNLEIEIER